MEERYVNVSRQPSGRRGAPSQRRQAPGPRRQAGSEGWDEPPRRRGRGGRSPAAAAVMGFYKVLVVISAIIVAVYLGFNAVVRAPEQKSPPPPAQTGNRTDPGGTTGAADSTTGTAPERQLRKGVYNIFLAATDMEGYRTDIMMVLCYDTVEQRVGVVSIPRDTLVARDSGNPHLVYGKGGLDQRIADVSSMLGVPIDYYIKVNIKGFITLVDYLDGVDFYVPCDMNYDDPYQDLHIHYTEGMYHLNGQQAMEVARFRKNNGDGSGYSDIGRTETQQKLLIALAKKVLSWGNLTRINGFVEIFNQNVDTDLSMNDMLYFASQAIGLDPSAGVEAATLPGRGDGVYRGYRYCYVLDQEETLALVNRLVNPYDRPLTLEDMNLAKADSYTG